ncbi:AbrB/MazE/SpoVT family DNA-binding domain-containing protein [Candidatus Peregrinibacteria bacterium]|nr:AbrB/MazE/SpoVT family DNA-binding domain-containing protein [Candidatus Peregrinibacteria bacterium]
MTKIVYATSRGQVTIPKKIRDKVGTECFQVFFDDKNIILKPLQYKKTLEEEVEESWQEYLNGDSISQEELMKKYGL